MSASLKEDCGEEEVGLQFRGKPVYSDGALKLWCQDKAPYQRLENAVSTMRLPSMENLSMKNGKEGPRGLWIAG